MYKKSPRSTATVPLTRRKGAVALVSTHHTEESPPAVDLAALSHDMRTPLCGIMLYNDRLRNAPPDSDERESFHQGIEALAKRLTTLTHKLTAFRPVLRDEISLGHKGISLKNLLEETVRLHSTLYGGQGFTFALEIPNKLPYLLADRSALARVLDNLLDNAVKYSQPHRILMRAFAHRRQSGLFVVIEVQDQGPGIPSEHWPHLFKRHYRAGHQGAGHGLGLSIVQHLVEHHRGHIEVDNTPGGGTTFRIVLPVNPHSIQRHVYQQK